MQAFLEVLGQILAEISADAIRRRFGRMGCLVALLFFALLIALLVWLIP